MTARTSLCCLAALWLATSPLPAQGQGGPTVVRAAKVVREQRAERRRVPGNLRAVSRAEVAAIEPGRVVEVAVRESDRVAEGDLLARIDPRRIAAELAAARAELDTARAELDIRRTEAEALAADLESYRAAAKEVKGSVSALALRAAERDARVARARVQVAERGLTRLEAQVQRLEISLEDTTIRAPFDGRVAARQIERGEWLNAGSAVCTLVSTGPIEAWLEVPEEFSYADLAVGVEVAVRIETLGVTVAADSVRVVPDVDPRARRFTLIATLSSAEHALAPGMSVTAALPTGAQREYLGLPSDALQRDGGGYFVYRVSDGPQGSQLAAPVSVQRGFLEDQRIWVDSAALQPGDLVVTEGNERLRPMTPVKVVDGGAPR